MKLFGGFAVGAQRRTQADPVRFATVLDGQSRGRVLEAAAATEIDGFILQNGRAGGKGGGGLLIDGGNAIVRRCFFLQNTNTAGRASALFVTNRAQPTIESCVFFRNGDSSSGHVIDVENAGGTYVNIVVAYNFSNGLHFLNGSDPKVYSSIFLNNSGRGLCDIGTSNTPVVENVLSFGNSAGVYHYRGKDFQTVAQLNALPYAKSNLSVDPKFVNGAQGDFRLQPGSPAIDAGHATVLPQWPRDVYGAPRLLDGDFDRVARVDLGAHEWGMVRLELGGNPFAGQAFTLRGTGQSGSFAILVLGATPKLGIPVPGIGALFTSDPWAVLPWGPLPTQAKLTVPASLKGVLLQVQALAVDPRGVAHLSNGFDLTL